MKEETKGLYLAIVLSTIAILAINWIWPAGDSKSEAAAPAVQEAAQTAPKVKDDTSALYKPANRKILSESEALKQDQRVDIANAKVVGSLRVKGARFDNISLTQYKQTLSPDSDDVELLTPTGTQAPYYAEFGGWQIILYSNFLTTAPRGKLSAANLLPKPR